MTEPKRHVAPWFVIAPVIGFELAYLIYFFSFDLPNAVMPGDPNRHYSRLLVWQLAVPGYVPHSTCLALQALQRLGTTTYLPQRLPIVGVAALIVGAAICSGSAVLRGIGLHQKRAYLSGRPPTLVDSSGASKLHWVEQLVMSFGVGMSLISLATLGLGLFGWLTRPAVVSVLSAGIIAVVVLAWRGWGRFLAYPSAAFPPLQAAEKGGGSPLRPEEPPPVTWRRAGRQMAFVAGSVAVGAFLIISLLGSMLPATDFDVREYHVQGPKEFFLAGRVGFAPHNVYMNMPFGTEMLTLLAMVIAGDWWWGALAGQAVLAAFAPMTALGVWALGRRLFCPEAGWLAALIYLTTPWVYRISIIPYTENALCFYLLSATLAAVLAIQRCGAVVPTRMWWVAGALAGSAAACKYPAIVSTVVPLGTAALVAPLFQRLAGASDQQAVAAVQHAGGSARLALQSALAFALGVVLAFGPWIAKNWTIAGNPVYPLLSTVFGGRGWTAQKNAKWEWSHRVALLVAAGFQNPPKGGSFAPDQPQHAISFRQFRTNLIDVTTKADWQSPLVFGLAPLALLIPRRRGPAAWLWLLVGYLFLQWWLLTHRLDRFWVPLLPVASVLAGAGAVWSSSRVWRSLLATVVVLVVFYNFSYSSTVLCGYNQYTERLMDRTDPLDETVNWMNGNLPRTARVLAVGAADLFHLDRPLLYNTVFDDSLFEQMAKGRTPPEVSAALESQGITHVYVSWWWIARYRELGNYGYTEFVVPSEFRKLNEAGVLRRLPLAHFIEPATVAGERVPAVELYEVVSGSN